jgi:tetratricopeptide (TPR) repeat protein
MVIVPRHLGLPFAILLAILSPPRLLASDDTQADALLQQGKVDQAAAMLQQTISAQPADALAHNLLCRVYYVQEMSDQAIRECDLAVSQSSDNSNYAMWQARAYGQKASHASPFSAYGLAKKVGTSFERAVQLNPANVRAISDLGEFYVAAPPLVGGGLDKAQALAAKIQSQFPSLSHRILALIAEKKKDMTTAEAEFKAAVAAGKTPDAYVDLGHFYQRRNQPDKVLSTLQAAFDADHKKDASLVDIASILTSAHQSPQLAETCLRNYLASPAKSEDAPAFKVHVQLGNLLARNGDTAGAHSEYEAALALASHYAPARKALQGS